MKKIGLNFFARSIKEKISIYLRITFDANEYKIATGIIVSDGMFDKKKQQIVKHYNQNKLNTVLTKMQLDVLRAVEVCEAANKKLTIDIIKAALNGHTVVHTDFYDFSIDWLRKNQKRLAYGTHNQLKADITKFCRFAPKISLGEIDKSILINYHRYLQTELNNNPNTAQRSMKKIKFFCGQAFNEGLIKSNPFAGLQFKGAPAKEILCLTEKQISEIENFKWETSRLSTASKLFLLQCYTGLAYIDLQTLKPDHVRDVNGKLWINKSRHKSDISALIPMFPKTIDTLKDLNFWEAEKLPVASNQKYNEALKEIANVLGFNNNLSTHVGRKTCGMILLNNGVSLEAVSRILGHSSIKTTQNFYAKAKEQLIEKETENFKVFG